MTLKAEIAPFGLVSMVCGLFLAPDATVLRRRHGEPRTVFARAATMHSDTCGCAGFVKMWYSAATKNATRSGAPDMRSFLAFLTLWISTGACAQGLPVAELRCSATANGVQTTGLVQISLFTYGNSAAVGSAAQRQQIKFLILEGRANEIPGTLNVIGVFDYAGARLDLDVMLTGGTTGTGQYWFNGMSHRATIVQLELVSGGFVTVDEYGVRGDFRCQ